MDAPQAFGKIVRRERKRLELSQETLAGMADLHVNYVGLIERGKTAPALDSVFALAGALGLRPSQLLEATELLMLSGLEALSNP
jgi:transcriptional regulator with XRE-family HTH domain